MNKVKDLAVKAAITTKRNNIQYVCLDGRIHCLLRSKSAKNITTEPGQACRSNSSKIQTAENSIGQIAQFPQQVVGG